MINDGLVFDNIINNLSNPCAKSIFTELENGIFENDIFKPEVQIVTNSIFTLNFSETILKLFEDSTQTNYTILNGNVEGSTGTLSGNKAVKTEAITENYYAITLDEDMTTNRSALEVANTILHESIHALLLKHQFGDGTDSFMDIFSNYITQTTDLNSLHHSIMRDKYILPMANALALYDGNREDSFIYENLALSGVIETLTAQQQSDYSFAVQYIRSRSGLNCEE